MGKALTTTTPLARQTAWERSCLRRHPGWRGRVGKALTTTTPLARQTAWERCGCPHGIFRCGVLFHELFQLILEHVPLVSLNGLRRQRLPPRRRLSTQRVRRIARCRLGKRGGDRWCRGTQVDYDVPSIGVGACHQPLAVHQRWALWENHLGALARPTGVQYMRGLWNVGGDGGRCECRVEKDIGGRDWRWWPT